MKKKFDFSAEMSEVESIKTTPRDFAFRIDLESSYLLYSHCRFRNWYSVNSTEVFR